MIRMKTTFWWITNFDEHAFVRTAVLIQVRVFLPFLERWMGEVVIIGFRDGSDFSFQLYWGWWITLFLVNRFGTNLLSYSNMFCWMRDWRPLLQKVRFHIKIVNVFNLAPSKGFHNTTFPFFIAFHHPTAFQDSAMMGVCGSRPVPWDRRRNGK